MHIPQYRCISRHNTKLFYISLVIIERSSKRQSLCPLMAALTLETACINVVLIFKKKTWKLYQAILLQPRCVCWKFCMFAISVVNIIIMFVLVANMSCYTQKLFFQKRCVALKINIFYCVISIKSLPLELLKAHHIWFLIEVIQELRTERRSEISSSSSLNGRKTIS